MANTSIRLIIQQVSLYREPPEVELVKKLTRSLIMNKSQENTFF